VDCLVCYTVGLFVCGGIVVGRVGGVHGV
jgi:hypothetical protein